MNIQEYLNYTPRWEEKSKRRATFLQVHSGTHNQRIQAILEEIQNRKNLSESRTLH